jgi:light-regulated signal transduction histidine kinase (bacteriophytochrome)
MLTFSYKKLDMTDIREQIVTTFESIVQEAWRNSETGNSSLEVVDDPFLMADPTRLQRLFETLFQQLTEHRQPDSTDSALTITVGSESEFPFRTIYVADDGIGTVTEQEQLLENGADGIGNGLEVAEQIATVHDWEMTVTESETGGTRIEFSHVCPPL